MNPNPSHHELDDELLSAYLDDELSVEERAAIERRLSEDPAAQRLLDELQHVSQSVRALPHQPVGRDLRDSVLRRVEDAQRGAASTSADASADGAIPTFSIGRSRRGWFWASLAVAAALVIMFLQPKEQPDDELPPVAHRDREPAMLSAPPDAVQPDAAPAASTLATAPEEAESEAMMARGGTSAAREAPGVASGPAADRFAIALDDQPADELAVEPTLVVHVLAKREALEQRAFEKLLVNNGITVETETPPATDTAARSRSFNMSRRRAEESAEAPKDVEAVLVEAPPNVILSCLDELKQDDSNFLGVSVEDPPAREPAAAAPKQKLAVDLNKYNRGIVPQQQKQLLARNKSYYQTPQLKSQGGAYGYADVSQQEQQAELRAADKMQLRQLNEQANQGRAQRVQIPDLGLEQSAASRELLRRATPPASAADDSLQVLFVLGTSNGLPAASTATPSTAAPAQQPQ